MRSLFANFPAFDFCEKGAGGAICWGIQASLGPIGIVLELFFKQFGSDLKAGFIKIIEDAANIKVGFAPSEPQRAACKLVCRRIILTWLEQSMLPWAQT
jgi:hypothetical protein